MSDYDEVVKKAYWAEKSLKDVIVLEQQRIMAMLPQLIGQMCTCSTSPAAQETESGTKVQTATSEVRVCALWLKSLLVTVRGSPVHATIAVIRA